MVGISWNICWLCLIYVYIIIYIYICCVFFPAIFWLWANLSGEWRKHDFLPTFPGNSSNSGSFEKTWGSNASLEPKNSVIHTLVLAYKLFRSPFCICFHVRKWSIYFMIGFPSMVIALFHRSKTARDVLAQSCSKATQILYDIPFASVRFRNFAAQLSNDEY